MKNSMKKFVAFVVIAILCMNSVSVLAYRNGDVIGKACYTDIAATINGHDIASYNVNGYTYIIAEDLQYYGFDVYWNSYSRTLSISRNNSYYVSTTYERPFVAQSLVGVKSHNLLYTDIETYVNGSWVQSYNINGRTIIRFEELRAFGQVSWLPEQKTITLYLSGLVNKSVNQSRLSQKNTYLSRARQIDANESYFAQTAMSQYELNAGSYDIYTQWDALLNDIYQYLKTIMPASQFSQLQKDEYDWVNKKEAAVEAEYAYFSGGSAAPMVANSVAASFTKDRCYYLISLIK